MIGFHEIEPLLIFLLGQIGSASYGVAISREMHQGLKRESDQLEQSESWFYNFITERMYQAANTEGRNQRYTTATQ
jgi:hypothetical protein